MTSGMSICWEMTKMNDQDKERYLRWQDHRITQLSFSINLFLTFAIATLGFSLALIKDSAVVIPVGSGPLLSHSVYALAASIGSAPGVVKR